MSVILSYGNIYAQQGDFEIIEDVRGENFFNFKIHKDLPVFNFTLIGDSLFNTISEIVIRKDSDDKPFQTLFVGHEMEPPFIGAEYFKTGDFNFDGFNDIMLLTFWGATGNRIYKGWIFDPETMSFKEHPFLDGIYSPSFDFEKEELATFRKGAAGEYSSFIYKFNQENFNLIKKKIRFWDEEKQSLIDEVYQRKNDEMKLIEQKVVIE